MVKFVNPLQSLMKFVHPLQTMIKFVNPLQMMIKFINPLFGYSLYVIFAFQRAEQILEKAAKSHKDRIIVSFIFIKSC